MADNVLIKDASGVTVTLKTKDVGAGVECSQSIPTDTSGNSAWGTAGTANANVMTVQGIASGTVVPISGTVTTNAGAVATGGYTYKHIAAGQATTVIKAAAGTLHSITFNSAAAATNITTIYDDPNTVGLIIAIPNAVAATAPITLIFDVAFTVGLTVITTTANGSDMTIAYK